MMVLARTQQAATLLLRRCQSAAVASLSPRSVRNCFAVFRRASHNGHQMGWRRREPSAAAGDRERARHRCRSASRKALFDRRRVSPRAPREQPRRADARRPRRLCRVDERRAWCSSCCSVDLDGPLAARLLGRAGALLLRPRAHDQRAVVAVGAERVERRVERRAGRRVDREARGPTRASGSGGGGSQRPKPREREGAVLMTPQKNVPPSDRWLSEAAAARGRPARFVLVTSPPFCRSAPAVPLGSEPRNEGPSDMKGASSLVLCRHHRAPG